MRTKLLTIDVDIREVYSVEGHTCSVNMVCFGGTASGEYFTGKVIGPGVDTQTITKKQSLLSARYMLEGADCAGKACRIFIENSTRDEEGWHPRIVTDSEALASWETEKLVASVDPTETGVLVQIFRA